MAATANLLARASTAAAGTNTVIYTAPALQVTRLTEILLHNTHTAAVDVALGFGSYRSFFVTLSSNETLPLALNSFLAANENIFINPSVANVIAWHISGINDVNG